jgi:CBS domain-containing protein
MIEAKKLGTMTLCIRCRQTYRTEGTPNVEAGVRCPRRNADVALRECVGCPELVGVRLPADGRGGFVVCGTPINELHVGTSDDDAKAAKQQTTASIMMTPVVCVGLELSLAALESLFLDFAVQSAPVVDQAGRVKGMVSETDLVRYHQQRRVAGTVPNEHNVGDIMIPRTFSIPEDASIPRAAALLAFEEVEHAAVVNADGQVVGLVSALDVTRWVARNSGYIVGAGAHES